MTLSSALTQEIVAALRPLNPLKVVLFGSYAKGTAKEDSDIDLAVVVRGPVLRSVDERLARKRPVSKALRAINQSYAMDVLVYSSDEYRFLKQCNDDFLRTIEKTGVVLYGK
jgi:predicted nucleotidyltransferase